MNKTNNTDKSRYISILAILAFVLPAIFITAYAGEVGSYVGSGLFMIAGIFAIWETLTAFGFNKYVSMITALLIVPFFLVGFDDYKSVAHWGDVNNNRDSLRYAIKWIPLSIAFLGSFIPVLVEPQVAKKKINIFLMQIIVTTVMLIAAIFFKGLWAINSSSIESVFYFLLIAIVADSFGYFGGKYLGKRLFKGAKLAPKLSPKKTWAGAVVGFIFSFTFAFLFGYYLHIWEHVWDGNELLMSAIMAFVLSIVSPLGDLLFSSIKRAMKIKDFSDLLPGHGGIFDRIDAMSVVSLVGFIVMIIFS